MAETGLFQDQIVISDDESILQDQIDISDNENIDYDRVTIPDQEEGDQENFLLNLTHTKRNPLRTRFIRYTMGLPEYPRSDPDGFTYIVGVPGQEQSIVNNAISSVQYSMKSSYKTRAMNSQSNFGNIPLKHSSASCSGVKLCQYADPALLDMKHTYVSNLHWDKITALRKGIPLAESDRVKRKTYLKYLTAVKLFQDQRSCGISWKDTCKPKFEWGSYLDRLPQNPAQPGPNPGPTRAGLGSGPGSPT